MNRYTFNVFHRSLLRELKTKRVIRPLKSFYSLDSLDYATELIVNDYNIRSKGVIVILNYCYTNTKRY